MLSPPDTDTYQSILYSDELPPITRQRLMALFEKTYSELPEEKPKFHSLFWHGKDDVRFYNELLNELTIENRRPITYPNIKDKAILILILIAMLYNSGPQQSNINAYCFLSVFLFSYIFYIVIREPIKMCQPNRCTILELERFYEKLNTFITMNPTHQEEIRGYQKLKFRMLACLENQNCGVSLIVLLLDILINCAMIAVSILILCVRAGNGLEFSPDPILHIFTCAISISFTLVYFNVCYKNWRWLKKFKSELIVKKF
ncbi:unnamed protein product [Caenorhabditis brenneri]